MIKGFATENATRMFAQKYGDFIYGTLGKTKLLVTEAGFGCYRVDIKSAENKQSLKKALSSGINLVDTSSTYTNGNSELLVGEVLKELVDAKKLSRDSVVIVTKGGYLQGLNFDLSQEKKKENKPFLDLVEYQDGLEHCIHPGFLEDQITRSLERLGVETIDVYMLHNPEYYLKWAKANNREVVEARKEYYSRIQKAFEYLEKEVERGRIRHYGISSNTFPLDSSHFDFTSLETVIKIAQDISKDNHFCVIEFPMNLAEIGAYMNINQSDCTLLQLAKRANIGVLINRPLNAIFENKLIQLAEPTVKKPPSEQFINSELTTLGNFEKLLSKKMDSVGKEISSKIGNNLFISKELKKSWVDFKSLSNWQAALSQYFLPRLYYCKNFIQSQEFSDKGLETELLNYSFRVYELFEFFTKYFNNEHLKLTNKIKRNLSGCIPELSSARKLSNMSIRALRATEGVTTVLVGMIQPDYVIDVIEELQIPVKKNFNWERIDFKNLIEP
mgnify:CR=1 FL=1